MTPRTREKKTKPMNDGNHGKDGFTHCWNQMCCWGPMGSRKGAPKRNRRAEAK